MPIDPNLQRQIMGQFATGVTVVTMPTEDGDWGMTANAVTSLSLDPPLVLFAVNKTGQTLSYVKKAGCFAMNILSVSQQEISNRFATAGPKDFKGIDLRRGELDAPIIQGSLGHVECQVKFIIPGGDHEIIVGEIVDGECHGGEPLLYHAGGYREIAK